MNDYVFESAGPVSLEKLQKELYSFNPKGLTHYESTLILHTDTELTQQDLTDIQQIISEHSSSNPSLVARNIIDNAMSFGHDLMVDFAAENILLGITQAGKTKAVADYLSSCIRYAQTGSLYEVVNEIDRLKSEGLPQELEPFITTERLDAFKARVVAYLS